MMQTSSYTKFGANYNKDTGLVDFKLFSKAGTAALLCIFDEPKGKDAVFTVKMEKTGNVFEAAFDMSKLGGPDKPFYYGYRVFGPNYEYTENWAPGVQDGFRSRLDRQKNRFNPNKLAYDPYSRELSHIHSDVSKDLSEFRSNEKFYFADNAKIAPKSVFKLLPQREIRETSSRALCDEIIGEVHIKSLTALQNTPDKGTFKAAGEFAANIKALGVTMVEFLPLHQFDNGEGIGNYWGYMPLCYFAPHKKYAFNTKDGEVTAEFQEMIDALHREDIKVCMDVVYNHTGEARIYNNDPTDVNLFCYALIDNNDYYKSSDSGFYAANSGCHNDSNTANDGFRHIITDSLEYWIRQGVDAFRFDLAASLMDTDTGVNVHYDKNKSIIGLMKKKLEERGIAVHSPDVAQKAPEGARVVNLIAEPWTCGGHNAYQLGNFPEFFAEWNDVSRNVIRAFSVRPHSLDPLGIRYVLSGTPQKFEKPSKTVNYVSCHDGFTLWDLNSYDKKSEDTCGGSDWEFCSSYGGDKIRRDKEIRNQIAFLSLSAGCFMVQIDDIVLHSKGGNNNSYNIDGPVNYINFTLDGEKKEISDFIKKLIDFRRKTGIFSKKEYADRMQFFDISGNVIKAENTGYWLNTGEDFLAFISGASDFSIYAAFNKGDASKTVTLPILSKKYFPLFGTKNNEFLEQNILDTAETRAPYDQNTYTMEPHTIILMMLR